MKKLPTKPARAAKPTRAQVERAKAEVICIARVAVESEKEDGSLDWHHGRQNGRMLRCTCRFHAMERALARLDKLEGRGK